MALIDPRELEILRDHGLVRRKFIEVVLFKNGKDEIHHVLILRDGAPVHQFAVVWSTESVLIYMKAVRTCLRRAGRVTG